MRDPDLIRVTPENVDEVGIHCVASRNHFGRKAKVDWFKREYERGLRILMLHSPSTRKSIGFVEYAPGESAWRGIHAPSYLVVHCIWVKSKGKGHGSGLIQAVLAQARKEDRDGVAVVTSKGPWCAKSTLFEKNGFALVDERAAFGLYVKKLRPGAEDPRFVTPRASGTGKLLVLRHSSQCPFVAKSVDELAAEARAQGVALELEEVRTPREARSSPTPYGITSLKLGSRVLVDHAISRTRFRNILRQAGLGRRKASAARS